MLYRKLQEVAPGRLFPPEYYAIEYQLPDAPFAIRVKVDDPVQVRRAYIDLEKLSAKELNSLADLDRFKLIPLQIGKPVFNKAPEDLVSGKLKTTASITNWLVDQYMNGRIPIEKFDQLMAMAPAEQRSEVFCLIPQREQQRHGYLNIERRKNKDTPEDQFRAGQISLQEFEEAKFPELKVQREKESKTYPLPQPLHVCIICGQTKAQIKCMEC